MSAIAPPATLRTIDSLSGPAGLPLVGSAFDLRGDDNHLVLDRWEKKFGAAFKVQVGPRRVLILSDPALIAALLRDRPQGFRRSPRFARIGKELGIDGIFFAEGEQWREQRPMVMRALDPSHLKAFFPVLQRATERLHDKWHEAAQSGQSVDVRDDLTRFTVDVTCSLVFGTDPATQGRQDKSLQTHLDRIFDFVFHRSMSAFDLWRYLKTPADRQLDRSVETVQAAVTNFIEKARAEMADRPELLTQPENLLQALLAANEEAKLPDSAVSGNVMTFLLAGEDTTASLMSWTMDLLVNNPAIQSRLRAEVQQACAGGAVIRDFARARNLPYLDAVLQESLRLKPVAPMMPFQALRDTVLGDLIIPEGSFVMVITRPAAIDASAFDEPLRFKPERWLDAEKQSGDSEKKSVMPFGAGPRLCPGRYLANLEAAMVLSMALNGFEFDRVGNETTEQMSLTMRPKGLQLRIRDIDGGPL